MKRLYSRQYANTRSILNPAREYVPAAQSDIRATLERARQEQKALRNWRRIEPYVKEVA